MFKSIILISAGLLIHSIGTANEMTAENVVKKSRNGYQLATLKAIQAAIQASPVMPAN